MRTHTDREIRMLVARSSVGAHHTPLSLREAKLELANLPNIDLRGADLTGANLRGAMLAGALLEDACLDGADLSCANLAWSVLRGCSTEGTLLVEANLDEATVDGVPPGAVGAYVITITLSAGWTRKRAGSSSEASKPRVASDEEYFREKESRDKVIWDAHVLSANPALRERGSWPGSPEEVEQAFARVLSDFDLQELLRWSAETGRPLNLRGCNLQGANLNGASLRGACLSYTNATSADLRGVDLEGADLQDSSGWPMVAMKEWWERHG